jgi:hypothetical protein
VLPYDLLATRISPAFVIYLFDVGASMQDKLDELPRIDHVNQVIDKILRSMIRRSTRGELISPRYRLAMVAYGDEPIDILGGVQTIDEVAQKGKPRFTSHGTSGAAAAFDVARDLLREQLPHLQGHPAPMVCHLTDGQYTGSDPEPIAQEIMQMSNYDGNVLVENIYIGSEFTRRPISDIEAWPGVLDRSDLKSQYAQQLFDMCLPHFQIAMRA